MIIYQLVEVCFGNESDIHMSSNNYEEATFGYEIITCSISYASHTNYMFYILYEMDVEKTSVQLRANYFMLVKLPPPKHVFLFFNVLGVFLMFFLYVE